MEIIKKIVNFLFELNEAKRTPRNGWHRAGIKNSESVAEHLAAAGQIAFVLAQMENANAERAAALALFHDIAEIRTGDEDLISQIYCDKAGSETAALEAQVNDLPMAGSFKNIFKEIKERKTKEAIIAKEADLLELAIRAKIYARSGYKAALFCIDGIRDGLKTDSAQKLLAAIEVSEMEDWWQAIPEISSIAQKLKSKQ
jgi:putative hydrolases of HD superfamily